MTDSSTAAIPLQYMMVAEIRDEIVFRAGIKTDRYVTPSRYGLTKAHLQQVAETLGCEVEADEDDDEERSIEDLTLEETYWKVCRRVGVEYNSTAGNQWGLGREQLKAICRELRDDGSVEPEVAHA